MAYKLISERYCPFSDGKKCEFLCDTDADFESLPPSCTGSTALSASTGNIRIVNASGTWVPFGEG